MGAGEGVAGEGVRQLALVDASANLLEFLPLLLQERRVVEVAAAGVEVRVREREPRLLVLVLAPTQELPVGGF